MRNTTFCEQNSFIGGAAERIPCINSHAIFENFLRFCSEKKKRFGERSPLVQSGSKKTGKRFVINVPGFGARDGT